jgi:hypothetical protein
VKIRSEHAAVADLKTTERRAGRLAATLQLAVGNDDKVTRDGERFDIWKEISRADLSFLTVDGPPQVGTAYRKVLANANPFEIDTARRNLLLFREHGVLSANVEAALKEMNQAAPDIGAISRRCLGERRRRRTGQKRPLSPEGIEMYDGDPGQRFSDDDEYIVAGTLGGATCFWRNPGAGPKLISRAKGIVPRELTDVERKEFFLLQRGPCTLRTRPGKCSILQEFGDSLRN